MDCAIIVPPAHLAAFSILENKLNGYADDSTLIAVVPSPDIRVLVTESLNRDLVKVSEWCDLCWMKLNANKTKTMIVSKSGTIHRQSPALTIDRTVLKESDDLVILGVTFDFKMTFEKHFARFLEHLLNGLLIVIFLASKSWQVFHGRLLLWR